MVTEAFFKGGKENSIWMTTDLYPISVLQESGGGGGGLGGGGVADGPKVDLAWKKFCQPLFFIVIILVSHISLVSKFFFVKLFFLHHTSHPEAPSVPTEISASRSYSVSFLLNSTPLEE